MKIKAITYFIFFLTPIYLFSQNLVPNAGFEQYEGKEIANWESTAFSPDFYNILDPKKKVFLSHCGETIGNSYMHLLTAEVTSVKLISPLEKDKFYLVSIFVQKPTSFCPHGVNKITVAFTSNKLAHKEGSTPSYYSIPFLNLYSENLKPAKEKCKWVEFLTLYKATGTENYFHIGDFRKDPKNLPATSLKDSILFDSDDNGDCTSILYDSIRVEKLNPDKGIIVNGIVFDTNKSSILPSSFGSLDKLAYLLKLTQSKVTIIGHTDNVGDPAKNASLSKDRAIAVINYLVKKGVKRSLLIAKGLGDKQPIADNNTEAGRAKNRRVEFEIMSN